LYCRQNDPDSSRQKKWLMELFRYVEKCYLQIEHLIQLKLDHEKGGCVTLLPSSKVPQSPAPPSTPPLSFSTVPSPSSSSSSTSSPSTPMSRKRKYVEDVALYHAGNEARRRKMSAVGKIEELGEKMLSNAEKSGDAAIELLLKIQIEKEERLWKKDLFIQAYMMAMLEKPDNQIERLSETMRKLSEEEDQQERSKGKEEEQEE
jgi:hypothetical protein